ncbi:HAMP domain-containing histidine kinase [Lujinxingia sediminis]|uniref:histidine kinase n=1 Tax=Lujinxingia sediminis TaxID=2480984 RepID=A0ABY0CYE5_9DELT|nr:HAMP domain-containing sensor histidine kinase [Lujinxingia sediminis]RVU48606.1 HAMP domain-containing histidine kinase [Lujinxingia sediminis]
MRLSLATKVFIAFAGVTIVFSAVVMFGVERTQSLYGQLRAINQRIVPLGLQLSDVQNDLRSFHVVLNERDPAVLRRSLQLTRLLNALPENLDEELGEAALLADFSELEEVPAAQSEAFASILRDLRALQTRGAEFSKAASAFTAQVLRERPQGSELSASISETQTELSAEARALDNRLTQLRAELRVATDQALTRADDAERSSVYALGALSLAALAVALLVLILIVWTLRPLTTLAQAARRIGEGDYRPLPTPSTRMGQDEVALLTAEFNAMAHSLAERDARLRSQHAALLKSERLATIGRMTSLITHELRNPLSSINLNVEMLAEALEERGIDASDEDIRPLLETVIEEIDRLRDITEEYLTYARLPSPKTQPENLDDIVQGLIDFHQWEWSQHGVEVIVTIDNAPLEVDVDANQIRQALLNLIKNAVEASSPGDAIVVSVTRVEGVARVAIEDQGEGIRPEALERLFEPFFSTKSQGTGLGLPMTQQILEEHGGQLSVESDLGEGTRFCFELPLSSPH